MDDIDTMQDKPFYFVLSSCSPWDIIGTQSSFTLTHTLLCPTTLPLNETKFIDQYKVPNESVRLPFSHCYTTRERNMGTRNTRKSLKWKFMKSLPRDCGLAYWMSFFFRVLGWFLVRAKCVVVEFSASQCLVPNFNLVLLLFSGQIRHALNDELRFNWELAPTSFGSVGTESEFIPYPPPTTIMRHIYKATLTSELRWGDQRMTTSPLWIRVRENQFRSKDSGFWGTRKRVSVSRQSVD